MEEPTVLYKNKARHTATEPKQVFFRFEEAGKLCKYFNKFVDMLKKDREQTTSVDK